MSSEARFFRTLRSPALAVGLLLAIAAFSVVGTVAPPPAAGDAPEAGSPLARLLGWQHTFRSPPFLALVALAAVNLVACTWHRLAPRWKTRAGGLRTLTDLLLHASLLLVLLGGLLKGAFGFTGTENIYVGQSSATVFDWRARRDAALGFRVGIEELHEGFHPVRARLGLRRVATGERLGLVEVVEGAPAADLGGGLGLRIAGYDAAAGVIRFAVVAGGAERRVDLATKAGQAATVRVADYDLTLVAFRADLKEARARVSLSEGGAAVAGGWLSPQTKIRHRGLDIFLTAWGADPAGRRFCGIQVVRDPGAAVFWAGCILLALAVPGHFLVKGRRSA